MKKKQEKQKTRNCEKGIVFLFISFFFWQSRKIKVSKVELNLNVDRQNEIFQSVGRKEEQGKGKAKSLSQNSPLLRA
jgi:hypothetical protein